MIELLCMLAVWRISSLLVNEAGPFELFSKIRYLVGVRYDDYAHCIARGVAGAFCCVWCISIWVSAVITLALSFWRVETPFEAVIDWLAFSAGAIVVQELVKHD